MQRWQEAKQGQDLEDYYNLKSMSRWADEIHNKKRMTKLEKVWLWLQGKKTSVGVIANAIVVYLITLEKIDDPTAVLITTILMALGISANVYNAKKK